MCGPWTAECPLCGPFNGDLLDEGVGRGVLGKERTDNQWVDVGQIEEVPLSDPKS